MISFGMTVLAALACGILNALRGSGLGWLRPVVGMAAGAGSFAASSAWLPAVVVAAGLWLWLSQPWGRWYTLGHGQREWSGPPNDYERVIERVADALFTRQRDFADALAWLISGTIFALPLVVFASPSWALLTPATVVIYAIALRAAGLGPHVRLGEMGKGILIGLMAVLLA